MMIPLEYLVEKHNLKIKGVLHCGSSTGQERFIYDTLVNGNVIWIEAISEVYDDLVKNITNFPRQSAINACISDEDDKTVVFNISNNESQSSSLLELAHHSIIHPEVHWVDHRVMKTKRLDTILSSLSNTEDLNFINLDLQGVELSALKSLGDKLNQFNYILTEVNKREVYKDCTLIEDLDNFLSDFERIETGDWVGDSWTDALYKRIKI